MSAGARCIGNPLFVRNAAHSSTRFGIAIYCVAFLIRIVELVVAIIGITNAARGLERPLPIVGKLFSKKKAGANNRGKETKTDQYAKKETPGRSRGLFSIQKNELS
ncbi:MAG: hypothetical protein SO063_09910 [Eubacteriales bacterium]|nr:hypothetical protein [Eubacteriales bacterium]